MCLLGNSAPLSARYLSSQLTTLWQNAVQCVEESGDNGLDVVSPAFDKSKHTHALAQYQYFGVRPPTTVHSTGDFFFYSRFGQPDLRFLCNHEAVLTLTIDKANLNIDFGKSASSYIDQQMNVSVHNVQATYRLPFSRHDVKSGDSVLNVHPFNHLVRLVVLNFSAAQLINIKSDISLGADAEKALKFYLNKYFDFLHQGGNHILYDVPHADDVRIDYALQRPLADKTEWFSALKVHSVEVRLINEYLHWKWQNAIRLGRPADHLLSCLAEISSAWVPNLAISSHFFARFGAPEIKAFCPHEALVVFHVEDLAWFDSSNFDVARSTIYHDWTIAFLVEATEEREGSVTRIKVDLKNARFNPFQSFCNPTDTTAVAHFNLFIKFFLDNYLVIISRYLSDIVYVSGGIQKEFVPTLELSYKPGVAPTDEQIILWTKQIQQHNFYGFDEITALSEEGINLLYSSLWLEDSRRHSDNLLANLVHDRFNASFSAPTIRLLSNGKAIVWLTVNRGEIVVVKESERRDFWTWPLPSAPLTGAIVEKYTFNDTSSLAFEVDLKMTEDRLLTVSDIWRQKFSSSDVWLRYKEQQDVHVFKHLFLDFRNASYVPELSTVTGFGKGRESLTRLSTLVGHTKDYLTRLADSGYNVLYSVPVATQRGMELSHAYTDIKHQVVTKHAITTTNCGISRTVYESPVILLLGMYSFRALPPTVVPWHDLWVIHNRTHKTTGSVYLSKDAFLETRLLPLLERINRKTTVVPKAAGIINGEWTFDLTTWAQDAYRANQACPWKPGNHSASGSSLQYTWEHQNELSQKEASSAPLDVATESTVTSHTHNTLTVPTTYHPDSLTIDIKGVSQLKFTSASNGRQWSKQATATWTSSIRVLPGINHLNVELSEAIKPVFSQIQSDGHASNVDLGPLFSKHLPETINVQDVYKSLKQTWEVQRDFLATGMQRCFVTSPVVTPTGGLILQLCQETAVGNVSNGNGKHVSVYEKGRALDVAQAVEALAAKSGTLSFSTSTPVITPSVTTEVYVNGSTIESTPWKSTVIEKTAVTQPYFWQPASRRY